MDHVTRTFQAEIRAADGGMFEASLASDQPCERNFGVEVLDFGPGCVNLSRAKDGLPLLWNHDRDGLIGRVHGVRVEGNRLRGHVKFFDTPDGRSAKAAVESGHREMSVGYHYSVDDLHFDGRHYHVTKWMPLEASIVSIPADITVGISRALPKGIHMDPKEDDIDTSVDSSRMTRSQRQQAHRSQEVENRRLESLSNLARGYSDYLTPELVADAMRDGTSVEDFQKSIMKRMETGPIDVRTITAPALISQRGDPQDYSSRFSVARAVQAQVDPASYLRHAGFEAEISRELQRNSGGMATSGTLVPLNAFFTGKRDLYSGGAGGSTVGTVVDPNWIDVLRARSVTASMNPLIMPGLTSPLSIPRKTVASVVGWQTEIATANETNPDFGAVSLTPKRVGAYVDASKQLIITSGIAVENMIYDDLRDSVVSEVDRVALVGTGVAGSQPTGIQKTGSIGAVVGGTNGASLTWQHICDLEKAVDAASGMVDLRRCGYAINPGTRSYCKRTPRHATLAEGLIMGDTPNDEYGRNVLNGYACAVSSKLPSALTKGTSTDCSLLIFGDWSQLILAFFGGGVELIVDPYTLADKAMVRIVANLFCDVGIRNPASFAIMEDARLP